MSVENNAGWFPVFFKLIPFRANKFIQFPNPHTQAIIFSFQTELLSRYTFLCYVKFGLDSKITTIWVE